MLAAMVRPRLSDIALLFLRIANTTFGGGDPTMAALQREYDRRNWIDADQFSVAFGLARITPGTNMVAFCAATGWYLRGMAGRDHGSARDDAAIGCAGGVAHPHLRDRQYQSSRTRGNCRGGCRRCGDHDRGCGQARGIAMLPSRLAASSSADRRRFPTFAQPGIFTAPGDRNGRARGVRLDAEELEGIPLALKKSATARKDSSATFTSY